MKPLFVCLTLAIIGLLYWSFKQQEGNRGSAELETETPAENQQNAPIKKETIAQKNSDPGSTGTGRTREIGKKKPQGLTATWHPEKIGVIVSPYNEKEIKAIGVISGSKMTDSDGNELIVPSFDDSPNKYYPVGTAIDKLPGYILSPFTKDTVDARGIPPGSLIQDPKDPNKNNRFRTPSKK